MKQINSKLLAFFLLFGCLIFQYSCSLEGVGGNGNIASESLDNNGSGGSVTSNNSDPNGGDTFNKIVENPFVLVAEEATSTFSIDADGGAYSNTRRYLTQDNTLPPSDAIRTEEFLNYFDLDYPQEQGVHPITLNGEISECPWNKAHKLIRIGIKGQDIPADRVQQSNFVFLIDVSGSMSSDDKLDLLKAGFKLYVNQMKTQDRVAIVTYSGTTRIALASTPGADKQKIIEAIDALGSGGSTAGASGIIDAYDIAQANFIEGGNNRVILGTDGDFNVGISSQEELITLIEQKRDFGIYLTVLGVGRGNLQEGILEQLANNGNGTYEYLDNVAQLMKVFVHEKSKFYTVAKDVKVQVTFNPENVSSYRLIGYENRILNTEDFENDKKDAGEIGANQSITALYEIVPEENIDFKIIPSLDIDFRYKFPEGDNSIAMSLSIFDEGNSFEAASDFTKFTASVASFGLVLRDSEYKGNADYDKILEWLNTVNLADPHNYKSELKSLIQKAKEF